MLLSQQLRKSFNRHVLKINFINISNNSNNIFVNYQQYRHHQSNEKRSIVANKRLNNMESLLQSALTIETNDENDDVYTTKPNNLPNKSIGQQVHDFPFFDIIFLGSGGSNPSKMRGLPSTMLYLGGESYLFDAGEGTARQSLFARSLMDTSKIFITHMHPDHIFGLSTVILYSSMKILPPGEDLEPLCIYGPQGLHEYISMSLRLCESTTKREIIVHEFILNDIDSRRLWGTKNPWRKERIAYNHSPDMNAPSYIKHVKLFSNSEGLWSCVDDSRVSVSAGLVSHRIPCFSFIVKESNKTGPLLPKICKDLNVHFSYFKDLKNGNDVTLEDGRLIKAKDVTGDATQGRKLVIIGDTSDATGVVKASMNCDVLIHEATLDNCRQTTAVKRGHSTPSMAVEMAKLCNAKRLVLNHIGSQFLPFHIEKDVGAIDKRTDKELQIEAERNLGRPNHVLVARDFIHIKIPPGGYTHDNNESFILDRSNEKRNGINNYHSRNNNNNNNRTSNNNINKNRNNTTNNETHQTNNINNYNNNNNNLITHQQMNNKEIPIEKTLKNRFSFDLLQMNKNNRGGKYQK